MADLDIELESTPQPRSSKIKAPKSAIKSKSSVQMSLQQRIKIEDTFFKINYYFGGTIETEIEKVIPDLIERFKDKEDMDMSDMGDLAGAVGLIRTSTPSTCGAGRTSSKGTSGVSRGSSSQANWVDIIFLFLANFIFLN